MRRVDLGSFIQAVESRKRTLGVTDEVFARVRNSGRRRTAEKRQALSRIQQRARERGLEPISANF